MASILDSIVCIEEKIFFTKLKYNSLTVYVDVDGVQGPVNLKVRTSGSGSRRWNILVSQIECNNPSKGLNLTTNKP